MLIRTRISLYISVTFKTLVPVVQETAMFQLLSQVYESLQTSSRGGTIPIRLHKVFLLFYWRNLNCTFFQNSRTCNSAYSIQLNDRAFKTFSETIFMARRAIPMIAFPRVRTIYNYIYIYLYLYSTVHLREYALYT